MSMLPELISIPAPLIERWALIPAEKFNSERAILCYAIAKGEWRDILPDTIGRAIEMQTPTFGGMAVYCGGAATKNVIRDILTQTSLLLNVGKNLMPEQIDPIADIIFSTPEYKMFTVSDFRLAMKFGTMGKYGSTYDRLDLTVICSWLDKYWNDRLEYSDNNRQKTYLAEKQDHSENAKAFHEWVQTDEGRPIRDKIESLERKVETPFEPDEILIGQWKQDYEQKKQTVWSDTDHNLIPSFENYCKLEMLKLQK